MGYEFLQGNLSNMSWVSDMVVNGLLSSLLLAPSCRRQNIVPVKNQTACCCISQKDGWQNVLISLCKSWSSLSCLTIGPLPCHQRLRLWHRFCLWNSYFLCTLFLKDVQHQRAFSRAMHRCPFSSKSINIWATFANHHVMSTVDFVREDET